MTARCLLLVTVLSVLPATAQTPEPADLLPASALVSLEVRHPDKLAREVLALIKGTAVEDLYYRLAKLRTEFPTERFFGGPEMMGAFGLMLSPETINELGRFQGAAVALTGFDKQGYPEIVGLIHSGTSHLPGFFMRGQLSFERVRLVDEVEKVGVYRQMWFRFDRNPGAQPQERYEESGPYMVVLPGVIALTSSKESAREVILRYKGKAATPALSKSPALRAAAPLRERPGLFLTADLTALTAQLDEAAKKLGPAVRTPWDQFKLVAEPRAITRLEASLTLAEGDLELTGTAKLNPAFKSPLLELLPKQPLKLGSLAGVTSSAWATLTLGIEEPEAKLKTALGAADAVALSMGINEDEVPSKQLPVIEKSLGFGIAKDVLGRITELSLCLDQPGAVPLGIVQARDEEAAKFLHDKALPPLCILAAGGKSATEEVQGKTITVHPNGLASARSGAIVVVGHDAKSVAEQLARIEKKETWAGVAKHAAAVKALGNAPVLLAVPPRALPLVVAVAEWRAARFYLDAFAGEVKDDTQKFIRVLGTTLDQMGPLLVRLGREDNALQLRAKLDGVRATGPKLIDVAVTQLLDLERKRREAEKKP